MRSRDGGAMMVAIDFSTHRLEGYKVLLETGPPGQTALPKLQAVSVWVPGLLPRPCQEFLQGTSSPKIGSTPSRMGE